MKAVMTRLETELRRKTSALSGGLFGTFLANASSDEPVSHPASAMGPLGGNVTVTLCITASK